MPLERINRSGPPLTEKDIARIERRLKVKLLSEHRAFLLQHNGGRPVPCYIHRRVADLGCLEVDTIYGLGGSFDILLANKYHRDQCPAGTIVFAGDSLGNSFLIGVSGKHKGHVLFLDSEGFKPGPYLVARSWKSFLDKLRPDVPPTDPRYSYFNPRD